MFIIPFFVKFLNKKIMKEITIIQIEEIKKYFFRLVKILIVIIGGREIRLENKNSKIQEYAK